jgi:hypothetical protein
MRRSKVTSLLAFIASLAGCGQPKPRAPIPDVAAEVDLIAVRIFQGKINESYLRGVYYMSLRTEFLKGEPKLQRRLR